jgi:hypothetical protein
MYNIDEYYDRYISDIDLDRIEQLEQGYANVDKLTVCYFKNSGRTILVYAPIHKLREALRTARLNIQRTNLLNNKQ